MMFLGPLLVMIEIERAKCELKYRESAKQAMTDEAYSQWVAHRETEIENAEQRRTEERRHQELCDAIRYSGRIF